MRESSPITTTEDRPIYLTKWYRFFPDIDSAVDFVYDEGLDPTTVEAHPCSIGQAHTPDLSEFIIESWGEQYEDWDLAGDLSHEAADLCDRLQKLLEAQAPTMWTPLSERIELPAVDESKVVRLSHG